MAAERQEERSDEKQAGLWVEKVVQLASAAGQTDPPKVVFDKRKSLGLAAYHYPHDELALDPDRLAVERTDLYCHEGLILHELGHRAAPTLLRVRRYLCVLLLLATLFLAVGGYIHLAGANIGAATIGMLLAATAAEAVAMWILSWVAEFAADDYMCDQGGIARAAAMMNLIDHYPGTWTHPPPPMRLHRQLRRTGLPPRRR